MPRNALHFPAITRKEALLREKLHSNVGPKRDMETHRQTQTDTDRRRREDREKDKERNRDGEIEMERS